MKETCGSCKYYVLSGMRREQEFGTCRIRSTSGPFPPRNSGEWCGEFVALEVKKVAKADKHEPPKKSKVLASDMPPINAKEGTDGITS